MILIKWIKAGSFPSKINNQTKVLILINFKIFLVHKEILLTLHLFLLLENPSIHQDLKRKFKRKEESLLKHLCKMIIKNQFTFLNLVIKLKLIKNKEVKNHLIFLILVVFKINLEAKINFLNFQVLMIKKVRKRMKNLVHLRWVKTKKAIFLRKLRNLTELISLKITKVVTVVSVDSIWIWTVKVNRIIKVRWTGKILEDLKKVKKEAIESLMIIKDNLGSFQKGSKSNPIFLELQLIHKDTLKNLEMVTISSIKTN